MKKLTIAVILGVALVGLSGCGGKDTNTTESDTSHSKDKIEQVSKTSSVEKENTDNKKNIPDVKSDTDDSSTTDESKSSDPEVSKEKVSDDPQAPVKDHTIRTESGSQEDLSKARITLYQAGIDSYPISDDKVLEFWKSKSDKEEFIKEIQNYLSNLK